jgi:hypothetical protein
MKKDRSSSSRIVSGFAGAVKLGHPQEEANFASELKRGVSQQMQR